MILLSDLAKAFLIDKSNLAKIVKKLEIKPKKVRGKMNQWSYALNNSQIEKIIKHREGLPHNLSRTSKGFQVE